MSRLGEWWRAAAIVVSLAGVSGLAHAQAALPDSIIGAPGSLTGAQQTQLEAFVAPLAADLRSGDTERLSNARTQLIRLTFAPNISVSFRNALSRELEPALRAILQDGSPAERINALHIAGEIATTNTADLLSRSLSSEDAGQRYAAASGIRSSFATVDRSDSPAMGRQRVLGLVQALAARMAQESDPSVIDAAVRAIDAAGSIQRPGFAEVRGPAYEALANATARRILTDVQQGVDPSDEMIRAWLRAIEASRNALLDPAGLTGPARQATARLAGVQLRWAVEHAPDASESRAPMIQTLIAAAENTIYLMHQPATRSPQLSDLASRARWDDLRRGAEELAGDAGVLTRSPFNVPPADLVPAP